MYLWKSKDSVKIFLKKLIEKTHYSFDANIIECVKLQFYWKRIVKRRLCGENRYDRTIDCLAPMCRL